MSQNMQERFQEAGGRVEVPSVAPFEVLAAAKQARRQRYAAVAIAASLVVVIGGVAAVVFTQEDERAGITEIPERDLVPASRAALAAIALDHVDVAPLTYDVSLEGASGVAAGTLDASIRYDGEPNADGQMRGGHSLRVSAVPGRYDSACKDGTAMDGTKWEGTKWEGPYWRCVHWSTDRGELSLWWVESTPEDAQGTMHVVLQREDEYLLVSTAVEDITKDPRELDLEISVDELEAIVLDPRFGLRTSRDARQAGVELRSYVESQPRPLPWGWTPKALAAFTAERLDNVELAWASEFVEPKGPTGSSSGVSMELANGWTVHLLVVLQTGDAPTACPVDMTCRVVASKYLTLAWAGDRAAMFVDNGEHAFRMYVEGLAPPVRSHDEFAEGNRLHELTRFVDSEELSYSMDGQWLRRGEQLDFWIER